MSKLDEMIIRNGKLAGLEYEMRKLETARDGLHERAREIRKQLDGLKTELARVEDEEDNADARLDAMQAEVDALEAQRLSEVFPAGAQS